MYKSCLIEIENKEFPADLVLLDMKDFDVTLGMDWLAAYHASVDCFHKVVTFKPVDQPSFQIQGVKNSKVQIISALQARKLLNNGCIGYLTSLIGDKQGKTKIEDILIVRDYPNVCSDDLLGRPPAKEVEFSIALVYGTMPILKAIG